jgi:hypothetical protein
MLCFQLRPFALKRLGISALYQPRGFQGFSIVGLSRPRFVLTADSQRIGGVGVLSSQRLFRFVQTHGVRTTLYVQLENLLAHLQTLHSVLRPTF